MMFFAATASGGAMALFFNDPDNAPEAANPSESGDHLPFSYSRGSAGRHFNDAVQAGGKGDLGKRAVALKHGLTGFQ